MLRDKLDVFLARITVSLGSLSREQRERHKFGYLGCVRLTLFRNKNKWSDDLKRYVLAFPSNTDNKYMFKITFYSRCLTILM